MYLDLMTDSMTLLLFTGMKKFIVKKHLRSTYVYDWRQSTYKTGTTRKIKINSYSIQKSMTLLVSCFMLIICKTKRKNLNELLGNIL